MQLQAAPPGEALPGNADPGRIWEETKPVPEPKLTNPEVAVPPPEVTNPPPEGASQATFLLKKVVIEGMTAYHAGQFEPLYQAEVGKQIPLSKVYEWVGAITQRYRQDGYAISQAVLPPQTITAGVVTIKAVEGYISNVEIEGKRRDSKIIRAIANKIKSLRPLNMKDLEHSMLLINDLAGVSARGVLQLSGEIDGKETLGTVVDLAIIVDDVPGESSVTVDNAGSRYVGPYELGAQTAVNDLIGPHQQTTLNGLVTAPLNELQFVQVSHRLPVNSLGTSVTFQAGYAHSEPGYRLAASNVVSESYNYSASLSHPLIRSRAENLYVGGELAAKDILTDALGSELYTDRIRTVGGLLNYDNTDRWGGANLAEVKVTQGLDALGARETGSPHLSRADGHSDFTKLSGNGGRLQALTDTLRVYFAGIGQYAFTPLLSSEQFGFGGQQFGRAYDPSELIADDGIAGMVELRYSGLGEIETVQPELFAFCDIGRVWNDEDTANAETGASAGFGVRFTEGSRTSGNVTVAEPLIRRASAPGYGGGYAPRLFFSLSYKF